MENQKSSRRFEGWYIKKYGKDGKFLIFQLDGRLKIFPEGQKIMTSSKRMENHIIFQKDEIFFFFFLGNTKIFLTHAAIHYLYSMQLTLKPEIIGRP